MIDGVQLDLFDHEAVCDAIRAADDWYEGDILRAVAARRPRERVIVDAGAHIGNHSVWWLEHVEPEAVFAFEPMPETYALLTRNLSRYPNAGAWRVALSDARGTVDLLPDEVNRGRSHISADGTQRALAIPLDDYANVVGADNVSLIKIDVEGWQEHVLRGAVRTLTEQHPAILVEDGEGLVPDTLASLGLDGYRMVEAFAGANFLWEWRS